jgi:hypothetical protein
MSGIVTLNRAARRYTYKKRGTRFSVRIDNAVERPPSGQFIQGWAGDASPSARPVDVLMFQCGVFVGAAPAGDNRPEVATALRVSRQNFGFSAVFSKQRCAQDGLAGLITAGDRRFSLIYPTTP